jgi:hypothetical protein
MKNLPFGTALARSARGLGRSWTWSLLATAIGLVGVHCGEDKEDDGGGDGFHEGETGGTDGGSDGGVDMGCADIDLGSALGTGVHVGPIAGSGDDHESCIYAEDDTPPDDPGEDVPEATDSGGGTTVDTGGGWVDSGSWDTGGGDTGGWETGGGEDLIFRWVAPSSGPFTIDTFGSDFDTTLTLYRNACGGEPIECNDDYDELDSLVWSELEEGTILFIAVDAYSAGATGDFKLNIQAGTPAGGPDSGGGDDGGGTEPGGGDTGVVEPPPPAG